MRGKDDKQRGLFIPCTYANRDVPYYIPPLRLIAFSFHTPTQIVTYLIVITLLHGTFSFHAPTQIATKNTKTNLCVGRFHSMHLRKLRRDFLCKCHWGTGFFIPCTYANCDVAFCAAMKAVSVFIPCTYANCDSKAQHFVMHDTIYCTAMLLFKKSSA